MTDVTPSSPERILRLAMKYLQASRTPGSILLLGPSGSGKRTCVGDIANALTCSIIEIDCNQTFEAIERHIVPSVKTTGFPSRNYPLNWWQSVDPLFLFFSSIEKLPDQLYQPLYDLINLRRLKASDGSIQLLSECVWVIGSFNLNNEDYRTPEYLWPFNAFKQQLELQIPDVPYMTFKIARDIAAESGFTLADNVIAQELHDYMVASPDHLHGLRRSIQKAISRTSTWGSLSGEDVHLAFLDDTRNYLRRMPYRGQYRSIEAFNAWSDQFPSELIPLTRSIVQQIAERYYISDRDFYNGLRYLGNQSGISNKDLVVFCRWQRLGDSAPNVANKLKQLCGWTNTMEIDIEQDATWPNALKMKARWMIITDDFLGSGKTLGRYFIKAAQNLKLLLETYPDVHVRILYLVGFQKQYNIAVESLKEILGFEASERTRILVWRLLGDHDRCFSESSEIVKDHQVRTRLQQFCLDTASRYMGTLPHQSRQGEGYSRSQALVVFHDSVPNNTLPIIWYNEGSWIPLFPKSEHL